MNDDDFSEKESLIPFPCSFTIKVMGANTPTIQEEIEKMVRKHFPPYDQGAIIVKKSAQGNYLAFSITIFAENKKMLDDFYREASSHPDIKMVL